MDAIPAASPVPAVTPAGSPGFEVLDWVEPVEPRRPVESTWNRAPRVEQPFPRDRDLRRRGPDRERESPDRAESAKSGSGAIIAIVLILMVAVFGGGIGLYFLLRPDEAESGRQEATDPRAPNPQHQFAAANLPPATDIAGCIAYWSFDEGQGLTASDRSTSGLKAKGLGKLKVVNFVVGA